MDDRLRQERRRDVGRDGPLLERRRVRLGKDEVPAADPGRHRLRERRRVRDALPAFELAKARLGLALEADESVRVVFENRELVLADDLDEARATLGRQRPPARVLERRDRVQERRPLAPAAEFDVECVRIETFLVHLERDDLDPVAGEDLERTVVGRRLHQHAPGGSRELLGGVEDESLKPSDREHDPLRLDAVPPRDPLPERPVPAARPVREDPCAVALRHRIRALRKLRGRDQLGRRGSASEGDGRLRHPVETT